VLTHVASEYSHELIAICWRMQDVSASEELWCAIYNAEHGLEVRIGFHQECVTTQRVETVAQARHWSKRYRRMWLQTGRFEDVAIEHGGQLGMDTDTLDADSEQQNIGASMT
jgi:hypothetical protein